MFDNYLIRYEITNLLIIHDLFVALLAWLQTGFKGTSLMVNLLL